jgi:ATP-binding cassette subfamily F protein 3
MTVLVQAAQIHLTYGGNRLFSGVTLSIKSGERLAIVGENGAGKSTLLRIVSRQLEPDRGTVVQLPGLTVGMLDQHAALDSSLSVRAVVAEALGNAGALEARLDAIAAQMAAADDDTLIALLDEQSAILTRLDSSAVDQDATRANEILAGLRLPESRWETPLGTLSGGERRLVALARLLAEAPRLLLLDEPDNHLDDEARSWLEREIVRHDGAVALVTHDRYLVDRVATGILEVEDGQLSTWPGNYTAYRTEKRARILRQHQLRTNEVREYQKLKESSEALTQWARQNPKFATRAENQRRKVEIEAARLEATAPPPVDRRRIDVAFDAERGSTKVVEVAGLSKSYGDRTIYRPFDLVLRQGERVGLVGPNGAGKTTLIRMLIGREPADGGTIRFGPSVTTGYFAQEQETLDHRQTPLGLVRASAPYDDHRARGFLASLGFDEIDAETPIGQLSGGERSRLLFGTLVLSGANFMILDEPTNNLDIASIEVLEGALADYSGTLLTVSHDRYFLDRVCDRIVEVRDGVVYDYPGSYAEYDRVRAAGGSGTRLSYPDPVVSQPEPTGRRGKRREAAAR